MKKKLNRVEVVELINEIRDRLYELDRMFANDEFDDDGECTVENFYYNLRNGEL